MNCFAQQLRVSETQLRLLLADEENPSAQFGVMVLEAFGSAVSALILARNEKKIAEFVGVTCMLLVALKEINSFADADNVLRAWPTSDSVPLGKYHFAGQCTSALRLAYRFSEGFYAETSFARLTAYPNKNINGIGIEKLGEWQSCLWCELAGKRPELADWPLYSLHQWRDTVHQQISDEFNKLVPPKRERQRNESWREEAVQSFCDKVRAIPEDQISNYVHRRLLGFLREWDSKPTDDCPSQFNGAFVLGRAVDEYYQHAVPLAIGVGRCITLADVRGVAVPALRRMREMLSVSDIQAARASQYDAAAELVLISQSQHKLSKNAETAYGWIVLLEEEFPMTKYRKKNLPTNAMKAYNNLASWSKDESKYPYVVEASERFEREHPGGRNWLSSSKPKCHAG